MPFPSLIYNSRFIGFAYLIYFYHLSHGFLATRGRHQKSSLSIMLSANYNNLLQPLRDGNSQTSHEPTHGKIALLDSSGCVMVVFVGRQRGTSICFAVLLGFSFGLRGLPSSRSHHIIWRRDGQHYERSTAALNRQSRKTLGELGERAACCLLMHSILLLLNHRFHVHARCLWVPASALVLCRSTGLPAHDNY